MTAPRSPAIITNARKFGHKIKLLLPSPSWREPTCSVGRGWPVSAGSAWYVGLDGALVCIERVEEDRPHHRCSPFPAADCWRRCPTPVWCAAGVRIRCGPCAGRLAQPPVPAECVHVHDPAAARAGTADESSNNRHTTGVGRGTGRRGDVSGGPNRGLCVDPLPRLTAPSAAPGGTVGGLRPRSSSFDGVVEEFALFREINRSSFANRSGGPLPTPPTGDPPTDAHHRSDQIDDTRPRMLNHPACRGRQHPTTAERQRPEPHRIPGECLRWSSPGTSVDAAVLPPRQTVRRLLGRCSEPGRAGSWR